MSNLIIRALRLFVIMSTIAAGTVTNSQAQRCLVLSTKDGLPQSFVSGLVQDRSGFIWVGTRNGLALYDGISFRPFQFNSFDSSSLASNVIIAMKSWKDKIAIEYESSEIDLFDPVKHEVQHFLTSEQLSQMKNRHSFLRRAWMIDSASVLWGFNNERGLFSYDPKSRVIRNFSRGSHGLQSDTVVALKQIKKGEIWILTQKGISLLNTVSGKISNYKTPVEASYYPASNNIKEIVGLHKRRNGELMWGDGNQLFFFSPGSKKIRVVRFPSPVSQSILWTDEDSEGVDFFERAGIIYKYSDSEGLSEIDDSPRRHNTSVQSFLIDNAGLIWMGTNARGLFQVDINTPFFSSFKYEHGFAGDLLAGQLGTSLQEVFEWTPVNEQGGASGYHIRSVYDRQGRLWLGLKETVVMYDNTGRNLSVLPKVTPLYNPAEPGVTIKGIAINDKGAPVVVSYAGDLAVFDSDKKTWRLLLEKGRIRKYFGQQVTVRDLFLDGDRIWMTTELDGLIYINLKTRQFGQLKHGGVADMLPTNHLLGLQPDPSRPHLLWIGSYNGLICLNKNTLKTEVFGIPQGLPDQTVYSILGDRHGNLWFGTNKGLCRFDPVSHQVRVFQTRHGLPGDEFNRFHHLRLPNGRFAFGGTEGWTLFEPSRMRDDNFRPAVALTGLKINNTEISPAPDGPLKMPLNALNELVLGHDENTLTIMFAGLQFSQPQDLRYRYQLIGYDHDWVEAGPLSFANYTKIPPGKYQFRVNASNTTGRWSDKVKSLPITVYPPWWLTWWAYVVYALAVAGSIWYWLRLQVIRIELRKSVELKQQEARHLHALSEMKSRFFNNVTHDFRTPLTLILSPLPGIIQELTGTSHEKKLVTVKRNAEQLLQLINQLLDFSRLDAYVLTVDESRGALDVFTERVAQLFREEALAKGIELTFKSSVSGEYWFDAPKLERMLGNLIANAVKFTDQGGRVKVSLEASGHGIVFSIADTGIGIPESQIAYIFNRYYQADSRAGHKTFKDKGSGIGLSLVKEFADLQKGKVEVESQEGKGTIFRIIMPYQPAGQDSAVVYFDNNEIPQQIVEPVVLDDEKVHILIVEDNRELADFIKDCLPEAYRITQAVNGSEGLKIALEQIPDLIISDVAMPVMDGFAFCKKIKQHEETSHIPVILLTAKASMGNRLEGLLQGADDYLSKPFHVQELNLRVHNQLEQQRRLRKQMRKMLSEFSDVPDEGPVLQKTDPFLQKFYDLIEERLDNASLSVEQWAELMNMSRVQLHRKLKAISGLPAGDVVRNYRLHRAASFLKEGYNSSESAYRSGFESPAYFTKSFRLYYGKTPSEFAGK